MLKKIVIGLALLLHIAGILHAQPRSVAGCPLNESAELVQQVQSSLLALKALGLSDEQILNALEQKFLTQASLVSTGGVVKVTLACVAVVLTAAAIGGLVGVAAGLKADDLERACSRFLNQADDLYFGL